MAEKEQKLSEEDAVLKRRLNEKMSLKSGLESERDVKLNEKAGRDKEKAEATGQIELYKANLEQYKIRRLEINQKILRNKEVSDGLKSQYDAASEKIKELTINLEKLETVQKDAIEQIERLNKEKTAKEK